MSSRGWCLRSEALRGEVLVAAGRGEHRHLEDVVAGGRRGCSTAMRSPATASADSRVNSSSARLGELCAGTVAVVWSVLPVPKVTDTSSLEVLSNCPDRRPASSFFLAAHDEETAHGQAFAEVEVHPVRGLIGARRSAPATSLRTPLVDRAAARARLAMTRAREAFVITRG